MHMSKNNTETARKIRRLKKKFNMLND